MQAVHPEVSLLNRMLYQKAILLAVIIIFAMALLIPFPQRALSATNWTQANTNGFGGIDSVVLCMTEYNNKLYAGTDNFAAVWRNTSGTSWTRVNTNGFGTTNGGASSMVVFNGLLYVGTSNWNTGAEVWSYDGTTWSQVNQDGFGYDFTLYECRALEVYNNELYAVVSSNGDKFRVYKYSGSGTSWTRVDTGSWDSNNHVGLCAKSYGGYLWVGTEDPNTGTEIWRYNGTTWTQANTDGFSFPHNNFTYSFGVHNNQLYCGTGYMARVFRYNSGTSWSQIGALGLTNPSDCQYASALMSYGGKLYAGTMNNETGCEICSWNGSSWVQEALPGFGDGNNLEAISMAVSGGRLYVGTRKFYGAQVWRTSDAPGYISTFYFAEGYTGANFQEYLSIGNPNKNATTVDVKFIFPDGSTKLFSYQVPGTGRTTVNVNSEVGPDKEVSVLVGSYTANLVVERPMYFNYQGKWSGGSDAVGAVSPAKSWYFAEGTTLSGFDEYITVLNPGNATANLTFRYMVEGEGEKDVTGQAGAHSRATFKTVDQIGAGKNCSLKVESDQAVVAERPIYFSYQGLGSHNWTGGHDVVGTASPAKVWYLAEGTTRGGFEEWLCLQNPNSSPITVSASYMLGPGQGGPVTKSYNIPAKQRLTVSVNRELGPEKDSSVALASSSDFIAERPMYFLYHGAWDGGHDVLGAKAQATTWFLAEGYTGPGFEEWLCVQNPGTTKADLTITYYPQSGSPITCYWSVDPHSRQTINVNNDAGSGLAISTGISSNQPIIVERPMYFDYGGCTGGHDVVGFVPSH